MLRGGMNQTEALKNKPFDADQWQKLYYAEPNGSERR